jgi:pyruvate/2-oxoglutarate dehydrogenase complex dihydrolipoamide dehydrogenase (E3) component
MIASAHIAHLVNRSEEYGVHRGKVQVDLKEVKQRKEKIVKTFRQGIESSFGEAPNLTLIRGRLPLRPAK